VGNPAEIQAVLAMKRPRKPSPVMNLDLSRNIDLAIDTTFQITSRMPVHLHTKFGSYDSSSSYENGHLRINRTLSVSGMLVEPPEWEGYIQYLKSVEADEEAGFTLERNTQSAAASPQLTYGNPKVQELIRTGVAANKEGRFEDARKDLEEAARLDSKNGFVWNNLGVSYLGLHQVDKAEQALERQLQINPRDQWAHNNLGRAYLQRHQPEQAIQEFQKQLEINPQDQFSHGNWAVALEMQEKWPEVAEQAEKANKVNPNNPMGWLLLGKAQAKMGQREEARDSLNHALQISDNTTVQNELHSILLTPVWIWTKPGNSRRAHLQSRVRRSVRRIRSLPMRSAMSVLRASAMCSTPWAGFS
ncbi:MAG: tetratricopeptide repeat protein, partial [Bryobacteraceae bacterium]